MPTLKPQIKQLILSASANALKCSQRKPDPMQSFLNIHLEAKRATPEKFMIYKHAILLYKLLNYKIPMTDWIDLNFQQTFGTRVENLNFFKIREL